MILHQQPYLEVLARHLLHDPAKHARSMVEALDLHARNNPDKTAYFFKDSPTTYGQLGQGINDFAAYLKKTGIKQGDRVLLKLQNSREFFFAYYGIQRLGAVAVPMYHESSPQKIARLAHLSQARALVTGKPLENPAIRTITGLLEDFPLALMDLETARSAPWTAGENIRALPFPHPLALAMLQYTSGTTGDPKGVMLTHANLLANVRQMIPKARFTPEDVFVSWLPVYHDMGLITMTMCPFYLGATLVLLPVALKPDAWFGAIKKYGGTMTAAPDFAYRFCVQCSRKGSHYDLSSLKTALIAAEPIRPKTVAQFEEKFNVPGVMKPGFGLAESSVAVTFWDRTGPIKIDADNFVSSGTPLPGIDLAIAGDKKFLGFNRPGEVVFRSPSATCGYYRNPGATMRLHFRDGFVRTGDIGYIDEDHNLFIVDRDKNIIIRAGRNISPREFEEVVDSVEGVRQSAVFGIDTGKIDGERIHLVAEINERRPGAHQLIKTLPAEIMKKTTALLEHKPDKIIIAKLKTIPRTYNGKIRYNELKSMFMANKLDERILN